MRSLIPLIVCALSVCSVDAKPKRAKNVILLLADAGGIPTINAASIYGYNAPMKLFIQSWPHIGLSDTTPHGRWVSDSAAGMTAIVTGQKTWNGVISQALYFRGGNSSDEMVTVVLMRDGVPMRYFPMGAKDGVHVPLRVVEDIEGGSVVELQLVAPLGTSGTVVVDLGLVEH